MEGVRKFGSRDLQPSDTPADALATLERITEYLRREIHLTLRVHGITTAQYNVLQALRSGPPEGLTCSELGSKLSGADPDITRLLDRLAKQGLVRRHRNAQDRRAVLTEITEEGTRLLAFVAPLLDARIQTLFAHMAEARLQLLIDLLNEAMPAPKRNEEPAPRPVPTAKAG
ncbi:MAG: MarR family transcriptional regulator [Acidobacteriaceae bacterium]